MLFRPAQLLTASKLNVVNQVFDILLIFDWHVGPLAEMLTKFHIYISTR